MNVFSMAPLRIDAMTRTRIIPPAQWIWAIVALHLLFGSASDALANPPKTILGITPLQDLHGKTPHSLIPAHIRPLLTPQELEQYLVQLEGTPPLWESLSSHDMMEQSDRLFAFNRERDEVREDKLQLRQHPIAFVWSGELRHYNEEHHGYHISLGPEIIPTSWGLVRFKPQDIPDFMIATISHETTARPLKDLGRTGPQDIGILFMGTLVESEAIMYAFSHDGDQEGMILPVVNITAVTYFLK